jgi:hypothetical protein
MFLISSALCPKLVHHHSHSGLTSLWVRRSKHPVVKSLKCGGFLRPQLWTSRSPSGYSSQSNCLVHCTPLEGVSFILPPWGIRFAFYTTCAVSYTQQTDIAKMLPVYTRYRVRIFNHISAYPKTQRLEYTEL